MVQNEIKKLAALNQAQYIALSEQIFIQFESCCMFIQFEFCTK